MAASLTCVPPDEEPEQAERKGETTRQRPEGGVDAGHLDVALKRPQRPGPPVAERPDAGRQEVGDMGGGQPDEQTACAERESVDDLVAVGPGRLRHRRVSNGSLSFGTDGAV